MQFRVLLASDFFPPFIGGSERQTYLLSKKLAQLGHKVDVATIWHEGLPEHESDSGVTIHRLQALMTQVPFFSKDPKRRFHPPFPDPALIWRLRKLIHRTKPAIVHASGWIAYSCAIALTGNRIPLVVSARDYGYSCATRTLLYRGQVCSGPSVSKCIKCAASPYGAPKAFAAVLGILGGRRLLTYKISAVHSDTSFVQNIVERDLFGKSRNALRIRRQVIPSALDTSDEESVNLKFTDSLPQEPYILFVGALQSNKGLPVLLAAYQKLEAPPPLVLIGSVWPDTPDKFPPGVVVLKNLPHANVMNAWDGCLFGVVPSIWPEPFGQVSVEAMSRGKAVIAAAIGGIPEIIIDGRNGLLVAPGDVDALANALRKLIKDKELRERLGRAGQVDARRFNVDSAIRQFEGLYMDLINDTSRYQ